MFAIDLDMQVRDEDAKRGWGKSHDTLARLLGDHNPRIGVEVGVAFAGNAENLLSKLPQLDKLYLVDPYQYRRGYDDPMNVPQPVFDRMYRYVLDKLDRYQGRACLIRDTSANVAAAWTQPVDFVFIDAEHTYEGVLQDINAWMPHVRSGGLITGHDYKHVNFPGLTKAVHKVFDRLGWPVTDAGEYVWTVRKL
jgi:hypothetical protein